MTAMNEISPTKLSTIVRACGDAANHATAIMYRSPSSATLQMWLIGNIREAALAAGYTLTPIAQETQE